MKMKQTDYADLERAIAPILARPNAGEVRRAYADNGLSAKRYRWDILHASKAKPWHLYSYLDDSHIDTALRSICRD